MKEWYLMGNHKPSVVSGYEDDVIEDFAQSNFSDVLETTFSDRVILYNYDLSESKEIQCIIQGNHAFTMLNSMKRSGIFPIGTVKAGMYIYFDNAFWLIVGCIFVNINSSGRMITVTLLSVGATFLQLQNMTMVYKRLKQSLYLQTT